MITVNGPFMIALMIILFLVAIKWIEWYLFKNGKVRLKFGADRNLADRNTSKLSVLGGKLRSFLFFGEAADLKKPWYSGIPLFLFILSNQFFIRRFELLSWQLITYLSIAVFVIGLLEIAILLRANKEFFSVPERKKRFIYTQVRQGVLAVLLSAVLLIALAGHDFSRNQPDPPGLRESVDWAIEPEFEGSWPNFSEGLAAVKKGGKAGFIDKNGTVSIPFQFDDAFNFHEGMAAVQKGRNWGYIDQNGEVLIPFQYEEAHEFSEGLASVQKDGKWIVIDQLGTVSFETEYEYIYPFCEGVAIVDIRENQSWNTVSSNLIDREGRQLYQKNYAFNGSFSEGCIPVMDAQSGKGYFLDMNEKKAVPIDFIDAGSFSGGSAPVLLENGEYALINHEGIVVRKLKEWEYYSFINLREGLSIYNEGDWQKDTLRYGLKDKYGNIIIQAVFQNISSSSDGMIGLTVDGLWGFIENPLPEAARRFAPAIWSADRTRIGTVEGLPVYAGELESRAYELKMSNAAAGGRTIYQQAFEQIKLAKAAEKHGDDTNPDTIQYQIGDPYYKKLLLGGDSINFVQYDD